MSMGFTLAASTFTRTSVGLRITGILTLVSRTSLGPLYECICHARIRSSELSSNLSASFVKERSCDNRAVRFNFRIVLHSISFQDLLNTLKTRHLRLNSCSTCCVACVYLRALDVSTMHMRVKQHDKERSENKDTKIICVFIETTTYVHNLIVG